MRPRKCPHPDSERRTQIFRGKVQRYCPKCKREMSKRYYHAKKHTDEVAAAEREADEALKDLREWMQSEEAKSLVA